MHPLVIQTIFMVVVAYNTWTDNWPDSPAHDFETRVVVVLAIVVFVWGMTEYFFGHTMRQLWMLTEGRFSTCSLLMLWPLYIWESVLTLGLLVFGTWFLVLSETSMDAILNALALNYIVEIDDMVANHTTAIGGLGSCKVPSNTVLPETNKEWTSCSRIWALLSVNLVNQPILPLLWALLWCHVIDGNVLDSDDFPLALVLVLGAIALVVLTSRASCKLLSY